MEKKNEILKFSNKKVKILVTESNTGEVGIIIKRNRGWPLYSSISISREELVSDVKVALSKLNKRSKVGYRFFKREMYKKFNYLWEL